MTKLLEKLGITPGPWVAGVVLVGGIEYFGVIQKTNVSCVTALTGKVSGGDEAESIANARLIACALEMLNEDLDLICDMESWFSDYCDWPDYAKKKLERISDFFGGISLEEIKELYKGGEDVDKR